MTYGYQRLEVEISNNKISQHTGLKRQNVIRSVLWLESKRILIRIKKDSTRTKVLIFNKNYDEWEPFAKREVRIKKDSKVRIQKDAKPTFTPIIVKEKKENLKSVKNGFDLFWLKYPQKKGKTRALKTWNKLSKTKNLPDLNILLTAIENQIAEKIYLQEAEEFCASWKYPSTWLNDGCWNDETKSKYSNRTYEKK